MAMCEEKIVHTHTHTYDRMALTKPAFKTQDRPNQVCTMLV